MEAGTSKKELLFEATMQIVAEKGLEAFSMRQVTKRVGTSESLIYRHFGTKENLLLQCFQSVDRQIAALFSAEVFPEIRSEKELYRYIHSLWIKYFHFLIRNDYRTLYYFEYRDSPYIATILEHSDAAGQTYYKGFAAIFEEIDREFHVLDNIGSNHLWTYILDVTGIFARRVIRGEISDDEESCEKVWRLLFNGMSGLLQ